MRRIGALVALALALIARPASAGELPGRIVLVGLDHQIYLVDPNGGEPKALTRGEAGRMTGAGSALRTVAMPVQEQAPRTRVEQRYSWPTWTADASAILAAGATIGAGGVQSSGVYKLDPKRPGITSPVYESSGAERSPIYIHSSPTGREAGVLVTGQGGLGFGIVDVAGGPLRPVGVGFPFYFAWRKDGEVIVTHVGGSATEERPAEVSWIDVASTRSGDKPQVTKLSDKPVFFRAPSWAPDGSLVAYAVRREAGKGARLVVRSKAAGEEREVASLASRLVFSWSPDSKVLAVAEATTPDNLMFGGVTLIHVADGRRETLYAGPVSAFFWAPDGKRLLVAAPEFDSGEFRWLVVERAGHEVREAGRFFPTPEFQFMAPHFDQFAMSHLFWSPDSRYFVYAGYPTTAQDESKPVPATAWIADAATGKVKRIADARIAFWSPR